MNRKLKRNLYRSAKTTALYIVAAGVAMMILFPVYFLASMSLMSDFEMYDEWPLPMAPALWMRFKLEPTQEGFLLSVRSRNTGEFQTVTESDDMVYLRDFIRRKTNCHVTPDGLARRVEEARSQGEIFFTLRKDVVLNYTLFFQLKTEAWPGFLRSLYTAATTIIISLSIGGLGGYAFARYFFKGKDMLKLTVLFVRMFPAVATAVPAAIILANMGLYDKPLGLSFIYSIGTIGLTIWITASVFMSIPASLEEAAMIFGTTKWGAFRHVTLPLALPGLAACAMYAFVASWNEFAQAIILTQFNPTFPAVVFEYVLGASGLEHLAAAGGMTLAIPAVIFYLFIRKYILRMWGGVRV